MRGSTKALAEKNQAQMAARRLRDENAGMQAAVAHERGAAQAASCARAQQIEAGAREASDELARAREEKAELARRSEEQTKTLMQLRDTSESRRESLAAAERRADALAQVAAEDARKVAEAERGRETCEETCAGLRRRCEKLGAARRERGRVQGGNRRVQVHVALLGVQRPAKGRGDHAVFPHVLQRLHRDAAGKQGPEVPGVRADVQRVGRQVHFFRIFH